MLLFILRKFLIVLPKFTEANPIVLKTIFAKDRIQLNMIFRVFLSFCLIFMTQGLRAQDSLTNVRLDQEGFYPKEPKIAVITGPEDKTSLSPLNKTSFYVISENGSDTIYRGELSGIRHSLNSSLQTRIADFSSISQTG